LINLEKTFRASVGVYRWRIKFIILGVATIFTARIYTASQTLLFQKDLVSFDITDTTAVFIACCFFLVGVLRPASFNVEIYPSEKVLRISITTILLGVYLLIIGLFSEALGHWDSPPALALKALGLLLSLAMVAIFLLSERSRDRFRRFVSRHFHRPMYDYRLAWLTFNEKTASLSSAESLGTALVNWVSEELKILSATIWLIDYDKEQFTLLASTGLLNLPASQSGDNSRFKSVLQTLQASSMPFDIDLQKDSGPPLALYFPGYFKKGGNRVCVPISTKGKPLAFLTLGDRVNGISFAQEEFDLLKCVADQSASILLNLELANRLLQAKEMEAFQTISAFFVHDLKNTASTLNLTLQNLPKHFDNPEFRKDALKSISKSVSHLQNLISRLTLFRQKLELTTIETDLNSILQSTLSSIGPNFEVQTEFAASMPICADREQLQKVFTNLILNAREASNDNSRINVTTYQQNGYSIATVSDNGCGMSSEFITRSLFRPFKTTKKGGIGIGMFQSKAIIDAHQGKIEVESQPGRGTTFRVLIPAKR
jgi:putative PEP-CTERM system histidine kinase